eukprot:365083-Chlamydomonas_euryale.AAC.21
MAHRRIPSRLHTNTHTHAHWGKPSWAPDAVSYPRRHVAHTHPSCGPRAAVPSAAPRAEPPPRTSHRAPRRRRERRAAGAAAAAVGAGGWVDTVAGRLRCH